LGAAAVTKKSRQWFFPYGSFTDGRDHPTGRFSNYMVQSDLVGMFDVYFLAKLAPFIYSI
jgi:hypothetical protein